MVKCIALDLDRTTLNAKGQLSTYNRRAIEAAIEKGVHVVIASGRSYDTLPEEVVGIEGIEYAVTSNGAAVYRVSDHHCLKRYLLNSDRVHRIMEALREKR